MNELFKKYLVWLLVFSSIILVISYLVLYSFLSRYYYPVYILIFVFYILITGIMHYILLLSSSHRPAKFNNYFLIATTVKLLIYLIFMSIYLYLHPSNAIPFLIVFFISYTLFSVFESVSITKQIRNK